MTEVEDLQQKLEDMTKLCDSLANDKEMYKKLYEEAIEAYNKLMEAD